MANRFRLQVSRAKSPTRIYGYAVYTRRDWRLIRRRYQPGFEADRKLPSGVDLVLPQLNTSDEHETNTDHFTLQ